MNQPAGPNPVMTAAIDRAASGEDLTSDGAAEVLDQIMSGASSDIETTGFLIALRTKGETPSELAGLARSMRAHALPVHSDRADLVDTAGTGGGTPTFNVSTTAAFVACGAGCAIAKHGNRSNTSKSGSADLLEALGANIELSPESVATLIDEIGFGFMFAPVYHAAMKYVVPVRKALSGSHRIQFPRAADQPGECKSPADRRLGSGLPGSRRQGTRRARHRAFDGRARHGPARRALRDPGDSRHRSPRQPDRHA